MRWILCAKNTAGAACLDFLVDQGDDVWAIGTAGDDGQDGWQRSFRATAADRGAAFHQPSRINTARFVRRLAAFEADALISIQYDQILRRHLFRNIGCPCLNLHFALLPRHRGVAPVAWAILERDPVAGVTLHHMIEDIDAGDVIVQRQVKVDPTTTARELYDHLTDATIALFEQSYPFHGSLLEISLPQDSKIASYHRQGDFDFSRRRIDWNRPAIELHAWLRAMIFPPKQYPETTFNGRTLAVTAVAGPVGNSVTAPPGTVVARGAFGLDVAAADRTIRIRGMRDPAHPEGPDALTWVASNDRFL